MKVGVLGTGMVGDAFAQRLRELGHDVAQGSRSGDKEGTVRFEEAAAHGELLVLAVTGAHAPAVLEQAGDANLAGKTILDISNPMVRSDAGVTLEPFGLDSMGEQLQRAHPDARIVKGMNTMNAGVMVRPDRTPGAHNAFICGEDEAAKAQITTLLAQFGWPAERVLDLGGIAAARGLEAYLLFWLPLAQAVGSWELNIQVHKP
jgi:8-hydroxy-5-deazaflavin:NADPH oxidoreductase